MAALTFKDWWNFQRNKVSVAAPPKCGNTTLKINAEFIGKGKRDYFPQFEEKYWICRHPVGRFQSFYANKILKQGNHAASRATRYDKLYPRTPDGVFGRILAAYTHPTGAFDNHWKRQIELYREHGGEGSVLVPLERLSELIGGEPQNTTKSGEIELSPKLIRLIEGLYSEDIELYEQALKTGFIPRITKHV